MIRKDIVISMIIVIVVGGLSGCQENTPVDHFPVDANQSMFNAVQGKVHVELPAGALNTATTIIVTAATNIPSDPTYVTGTAYTFEPDGLVFLKPVTLRITYDPSNIPADVTLESLKLAKLLNNAWETLSDSSVNTTSHTVSGIITGFSTYGVVGNEAKVHLEPRSTTCAPLGQVIFTTNLLGYPSGYQPQYQWNFSGTNGHLLIDPADYSTVSYKADADATENGIDTVRVDVLATFADENHEEGTLYVWGSATATITIKKTTVRIDPLPASCLPGGTVSLSAIISNPPNYPVEYRWTCSNTYGTLQSNSADNHLMTYTANEGAIEDGVDTVNVELWTTFAENGNTYKWAEGTGTITITKISLSISPVTTQCPPGKEVVFTAIAQNLPPNYVFQYRWSCTNTTGVLEKEVIDARQATYTASPNALDGGSDTITVALWTVFSDTGYSYKWAKATATVTIKRLSLSIDPLTTECTPNGQVKFTALLVDFPPSYNYTFRWSCTNRQGSLVADSADNHTIYYKADADATEATTDTITLELWTIFEDADNIQTEYKWEDATATVTITVSPLTEYSLVNANGGEIMGGGADMVFYRVGYGMIDYHSFQARAGEQIRMICHYRGYKADFENKDIYLKHGTTTTLLITWDELPSNEDYEAGVPALDRTFTLT